MLKHNIDAEYDSWLLEQAQLLRDRATARVPRSRAVPAEGPIAIFKI